MKYTKALLQFLIVMLLLTACGAPAPTAAPTVATTTVAATSGRITDYSIKIEQEQGSGDLCSAGATYFVTASITADGVVGAAYEVSSASSGGQIPTGGNFQDMENNGLSQSVSDAVTFDKAETKTITWRLTGPYAYPNDITVKLRMNDGEFKSAAIDCGSAANPAPTATPAATTGCTDSAIFVSDDGKDGTVYAPNTLFTKTWTIRNTGTCTWDSTYTVSHISGTAMSQVSVYTFLPAGGQVAPGSDVDISVELLSPSNPGDYRADWQVVNTSGFALVPFYLTLKVGDPNSGGAITSVVPQIVLEQGSGAACTDKSTYFVYVDITSDGATTAEYRIDLTDASGQVTNGQFDSGSAEEKGTLTFNSAGTQRVSLHVLGSYGYPDAVTVRVYVNGQSSGNAAVTCP